jgi:hypothetical protein
LASWTTAQSYVMPGAGGRIIWDVPATAMVAPLAPGTYPMEVRRTDGGRNTVVLSCLITIGKAVIT